MKDNKFSVAFAHASKHHNAFYGVEMMSHALRPSYNLNLEEFLENLTEGQCILSYYKKHKYLDTKRRNLLVDILIKGQMFQSKSYLAPVDLEILAKKISEIFPTEEAGIYYIPRSSTKGLGKSKTSFARGKLLDKYRNLKRLYKFLDANTSSQEVPESSKYEEEHYMNSKEWLKRWHEPWETVVLHWEKTFDLRRNSKLKSVNEFLEEWPILKHEKAFALIETDFARIYPEKTLSLYRKWSEFYENLKTRHEGGTNKFELINIKDNSSEDSNHALEIFNLSFMIPPRARVKKHKKVYKPTIQECQESIINHVTACGLIDSKIQEKKEKGVSVQPYIIVVGETIQDITESYIIIDNIILKGKSVMMCLDILFKLFHVINASYLPESEHIWFVIQRYVYDIETDYDKHIPYVLSLLSDLKK